MNNSERYFIGPNVRSKITDLFTRVDGVPIGSEGGSRIPVALQDMRMPSPGTSIRAGTFTGAWNIGSSKVVTFSNEPTATVTVTNIVWPLSQQNPEQQACLVGKEGTVWTLIVPVLSVVSCDDKASGQQLSTFLG